MRVQSSLRSQMSMHKTNQSESNRIPVEWWRGRRGRLGTTVHLQTSACAPPLAEHELDKVQNVKMTWRIKWGQQIKWRRKRRKRGEFLPLLSWICFVLTSSSFFCFALSTSSLFLPIKPTRLRSAELSLPLLRSSVHLWPWHPPQETPQLCLGLQRLSFTPVYSTQAECAYVCDSALWAVYKYTSAGMCVCTFSGPCEWLTCVLCMFLLSRATQLETAHL